MQLLSLLSEGWPDPFGLTAFTSETGFTVAFSSSSANMSKSLPMPADAEILFEGPLSKTEEAFPLFIIISGFLAPKSVEAPCLLAAANLSYPSVNKKELGDAWQLVHEVYVKGSTMRCEGNFDT